MPEITLYLNDDDHTRLVQLTEVCNNERLDLIRYYSERTDERSKLIAKHLADPVTPHVYAFTLLHKGMEAKEAELAKPEQ